MPPSSGERSREPTAKRLDETLATLSARGVAPVEGPTKGRAGSWARIVDPDGRCVVLTEAD